jgi:phytoene desaturase
MSDQYDVIIIGSGMGGLTSAALLAKEGLKVLVLERLDRIGGCCSNYDVNGFKPEVGAVFVIAHEFYYKLFELLDLRLEDYLDWEVIDPVYHFYLEDGSDYSLPRGVEELGEVVAKIAPQDVKGYNRYNKDMKKVYDFILASLQHPMPELRNVTKMSELIRMASIKEGIQATPVNLKLALNRMDKCVKGYFKDPHMQLMFGWENMYAGLPAHRCTGLFTMMAYFGRVGYYYPKGGMISIPLAMKRIAEKFGAEVRLNSEVENILIHNGEAKGIKLVNGDTLTARAVISNAHSRVTYLKLVGEDNLPRWATRTVRRQPCSIPAPVIHMGIKERLYSVKAHLSLVATPPAQFDGVWGDFYDRGLLYRPADGNYLIMDPSFDDPTLAPAGKQVMSVIYIAPYKLKYHDWDDIAEEWAWEVVRHLDQRCFPGLEDKVEWLDSVPPKELERRLNVAEGAFFGIEMSLGNMGPFRPNYRSRLIRRLYQAGQCTNPGTGVPGAMISGIATSSILINDWTRRLR